MRDQEKMMTAAALVAVAAVERSLAATLPRVALAAAVAAVAAAVGCLHVAATLVV